MTEIQGAIFVIGILAIYILILVIATSEPGISSFIKNIQLKRRRTTLKNKLKKTKRILELKRVE